MTSLSSGMQSVPTLKVGLRVSMGYVEVNDPDLLKRRHHQHHPEPFCQGLGRLTCCGVFLLEAKDFWLDCF